MAVCTSTRGMGAPAQTNWRRRQSAGAGALGALTRSARNGVAPMEKLTRSAWMVSQARVASHRSCRMTRVPSTSGIIRPYMKPVWWASGEAMKHTSSPLRAMPSP
ncbi:MAG: hypothetical protein OZX49_01913 [Immundisolibacter sp.]|nr:hypothetical protein [Immundisolibacter sp.]